MEKEPATVGPRLGVRRGRTTGGRGTLAKRVTAFGVEFTAPPADGLVHVAAQLDAAGDPDECIRWEIDADGDLHIVVSTGGRDVADRGLGAVTPGMVHRVASSHAGGDHSASLDGGAVVARLGLLGLPIDYVLASPHICVSSLTPVQLIGTDHAALIAKVGACAVEASLHSKRR